MDAIDETMQADIGEQNAPGTPAIRLLDMVTSAWMTQVLYAACDLDLPDLLANGTQGLDALAERSGCDRLSLSRLLAGMEALGLCTVDKTQHWTLTEVGEPLRAKDERSIRAWVLWWGRYLWPLWGKLSECVRKGESARQLVRGQEGYQHLSEDSDAATLFHQAMAQLSRIQADAILEAQDFSTTRHIVDVGGGTGGLLFAILDNFPHVTATLYDLPHAIAALRQSAVPAVAAGRCELLAGDFFATVPEGGNLYLLKSIVHNWDDHHALQILRNCARAMRADARILVVERVLPEAGLRSNPGAVRSDLNMLVGFGGAERTAPHLCQLITKAGFNMIKILPTRLEFSLFEARLG
ncbi:methyltransferase [Noviherbaspirillum denitrificans]|uniref:Methyltransferase n=1 Tax=Noviherbaspirillum denitrificans TaxID=1968433 RepID=A0A254TFK3_9BURK|nr:methyltransferase [Noviherbaspirillum denitrificans]OWW19343.1 hypothetical protein AYR66_07330 [Noviherbaspirillum denitrificans]